MSISFVFAGSFLIFTSDKAVRLLLPSKIAGFSADEVLARAFLLGAG